MRAVYRFFTGRSGIARTIVYGVLFPIAVFYLANFALDRALQSRPDTAYLTQIGLYLIIGFIGSLALGLSLVWRSAGRILRQRNGLSLRRIGSVAVAELAQLSVVVVALYYTLSYVLIAPTVRDMMEISRGFDRYADFRLRWVDESAGRVLLDGQIGLGLNDALSDFLDRHDGVRVLQLESKGGRDLESQKVAATIRDSGVATLVSGECSSACTALFLSAEVRTLNLDTNARLGFHSSGVQTTQGTVPVGEGEGTYWRTLAAGGVSEDFIVRVYAVSPRDIWYPSADILYANGLITHVISGGQQFAASTHGFDPSPPSRAEVEQWIQQAGTDGQDGRFDAAIAAYGKSLKSGQLSQGELAEIHGRRGNIYLAMANHDFALRDLDAAIAINAANPYYWLWRGNAYIAMLAPDRAIDDYGEAMRLMPRLPDAYANRAAAYMSVGKFDLALSDLDNVLQFAPDHALSRNNRCYLKAFALEDYAGALPDCDRAIALVDNFVLAYQNRAAIHERLRQFDLARRDYEKAAELAPALAAQRDAALTRMQRQQELMETPPDLIMN